MFDKFIFPYLAEKQHEIDKDKLVDNYILIKNIFINSIMMMNSKKKMIK
jgi:hypothetical protein